MGACTGVDVLDMTVLVALAGMGVGVLQAAMEIDVTITRVTHNRIVEKYFINCLLNLKKNCF
jgi:hypothetical protein